MREASGANWELNGHVLIPLSGAAVWQCQGWELSAVLTAPVGTPGLVLGRGQAAGSVSAVGSEGKYLCTVHFFPNLTLSAWLASQHFGSCAGNNTGAGAAFQPGTVR